MAEDKKHYSRYIFNRGNQALWKGEPSEKGAQFRQVIITSDEWMLGSGIFQVCALEGTSNGIVDGKLSPGQNPKVRFSGRAPGEPPYTLIDFFPDDFLCIVDESHVTLPQVRGMFAGDRSRKETLVEHGFRLPSALDNRPLKFPEFEAKLKELK